MKVTSDIAAAEAVLLATAEENARFDILGWIKNKIHMTITEKEIREDFARFIRHEAMRANCTQEEVRQIITGDLNNPKCNFE